MSFLPWTTFARIADRYSGDRRVRNLPCTEHFRALAFAQLTLRESLRDIETCLAAHPAKLYHSGFSAPVRRATLARANERRDWRIQADFAQRLIARARRLYAGEALAVELADTVYALDSTTIDLCLSVFPWANFRTTKAAVKLHTLLDLRGSIPSFMHVSDGKFHDVNVLDILAPEPGAIYVGPCLPGLRAPVPDAPNRCLLRHPGQKEPSCPPRLLCAQGRRRRCFSRPNHRSDGPASRRRYPAHLRRIRYRDPASGKTLVFLTNRTDLEALTICDLYKSRWQVELFFKWIKQHLRIKRFFGTSENAVKSQLWVAVSVYVLVATIRKQLGIETPLYAILQILSVLPFEQVPLYEVLTKSESRADRPLPDQLPLFAPATPLAVENARR